MGRSSPPTNVARATRQKPTERAFVIHFEPIDAARGRIRGRVEQVASGEVVHFRSAKQLVAFMVGALHRGISKSSSEHS